MPVFIIALLWIELFPPNLYAEALTTNAMAFGDEAFVR